MDYLFLESGEKCAEQDAINKKRSWLSGSSLSFFTVRDIHAKEIVL